MFDTIGRDLDREGNRRRAQSVVLSALLVGGVVGFTVGLGMYTAAELSVGDEGPEEPLVMIDLVDDAPVDATPPELPPAPPAPAKGVSTPEPERPEPEPDPDATPTTLPPPKPLVNRTPPAGTPDGRVDGDPDGRPGGRPGGTPGGTGTGEGGPAVQVFHHRELDLRASPQPSYPRAAKALGLGEVTCLARVSMDERGKPYDVVVERCPTAFHEELRRTLLRWRWYAPRDASRNKVRAQTVISATFRLDEAH
jgi:hypothetical protein